MWCSKLKKFNKQGAVKVVTEYDQLGLGEATEERSTDEDLPTDGREHKIFGALDWKLEVCRGVGVRNPTYLYKMLGHV